MRLIILGAESLGREAADIAAANGYESIEFLDDAPSMKGTRIMDHAVVGGFSDATGLIGDRTEFFVAVGTIGMRASWMTTIRNAGGRLATLVHSRACVSSFATVGPNTMISFGCHIGPNVMMGQGSVLWSSVIISHDCTIGNHCFFGPTVAFGGYTHVGDCSMFGCGAKLRPCITIGSRVVIGIGAAITRSVPDNHFVAAGDDPVPIQGKDPEDIFFGQIRTLPRQR